MNTPKYILLLLAAFLLTAAPAAAQVNNPTPESETVPVPGSITGQIVNGTAGAGIPDSLTLMLHVWDGDFNEKEAFTGQADANGRFQFDNVPFVPGWFYAVMATYQDVTYFSVPMPAPEGETTFDLELPIFESTTDTSGVQVEAMHIFFDADPNGLGVGEVYTLSNPGDRAIVGGPDTLADGTPVTFRFNLPPEATNVSFQGSREGRFMRTPDGFADTAPLLPGESSGQIFVTYALPYNDSLTLARAAVLPTKQVNVLIPAGLGLSLSGDGIVNAGRQNMGEDMVVDVYTREGLDAGETVRLDVSGTLALPGVEPAASEANLSSREGIFVGSIVLGVALIITSFWWYARSRQTEPAEPFPEEFEEIVAQIAQLDEAHEQQAISDEQYQAQRDVLREQARLILLANNE